MAKNQPVQATTQVGIVNGTTEGYATLAALAAEINTNTTYTASLNGDVLTLTANGGPNSSVNLSALIKGHIRDDLTGCFNDNNITFEETDVLENAESFMVLDTNVAGCKQVREVFNIADQLRRIFNLNIVDCLDQNFPQANEECGAIEQLGVLDDGAGCYKIVRISQDSTRIDRTNSNSVFGNAAYTQFIPADPTDDTTWYRRGDLITDQNNGTIDNAKITPNIVMDLTFTVDCDGQYTFEHDFVSFYDPSAANGNGRASTIMIELDGVWQAGNLGRFTSHESRHEANNRFNLTAGSHTIRLMVAKDSGIAVNGTTQPAQYVATNGTVTNNSLVVTQAVA